MRKLVILSIILILFLAGCFTSEEEKEREKIKEVRNESVGIINDNIDYIFATESLTDIWHIEDHILFDDDVDEDRLFRFTDTYVIDEEEFESLNEYEQGLAMKTSLIITKCLKGKYEDEELFKEDLDEYYDVLENGDDFFID